MPAKVLFISHDASRMGAEIALLHLLRWLRRNSDLEFQVLIRESAGRRGDLLPEFLEVAPVIRLDSPRQPDSRVGRLLNRAAPGRRIVREAHRLALRRRLKRAGFSLIYSNTVANQALLDELDFLPCPVLCHVHEMEYVCRQCGIRQFSPRIKRFVAVSEAVRRSLVEHFGVPSERIETIPEILPVREVSPATPRSEICAELKIPEDSRIVCAAGYCGWRKGSDLFLQVARAVNARLERPAHFIWVGNLGASREELLHDVRRMPGGEFIHFLSEKANPIGYFAAAEVFLLPSREDPFPLVCLEAAACAKPLVCFDRGGGMPELIGDDAGLCVPYLDTEAMAEAVIRLLEDAELRKRLGGRAREKVRAQCDAETGGRRILDLIRSLTGRAP